MNKRTCIDFRTRFAAMADQAVINRDELANLLSTTPGAISQMAYRGELPTTAFPGKRRACWFVRDIRHWLNTGSLLRATTKSTQIAPRIGRPRNHG